MVRKLQANLSHRERNVDTWTIRYRPRRIRSTATIWSLPAELLLKLFEGLDVRDLLNVRSTHSSFKNLIDSHSSVWTCCTFRDNWPNQLNIRHFVKASDHGNIEALVKLGVAYLYNEGLPGDFEGRRIVANGDHAADLFCRVECQLFERVSKSCSPFTWLFMRPPWAVNGACCKECVFNRMKIYVKQNVAPPVDICIARTLMLLEPSELRSKEICEHLLRAASQGSALAQYLLWEKKYKYHTLSTVERNVELQSLRELREIASAGDLMARLTLCRLYAVGKYGGCPKHEAVSYVREFIQSSKNVDVRFVFDGPQLTESMRYILVDWLAEVASIKGFDTLTLHVAISVADRFLKIHRVTRAKLQLLGVSAMVLCSRFLGRDIITIREAAWLTDNTYKYEHVVRMMGEISAVLNGNIRTLTCLDYTYILGLAAHNDRRTQYLAEYLCELSLLHTELSVYQFGLMASACQLMARLTLNRDNPWSIDLQEFTGYSVVDLALCVVHLHKKCFLEEALMDHRDVVLQAVKLRYCDEFFLKVGSIPMLSADELTSLMGVNVLPPVSPAVKMNVMTSPEKHEFMETVMAMINSPSRSVSKQRDRDYAKMQSSRNDAATPTHDIDSDDDDQDELVADTDGDDVDDVREMLNVSSVSDDEIEEDLIDNEVTSSNVRASESLLSIDVDVKSRNLLAPRHEVDTHGSGLSVLKSPSRHQVDTQGSGLSVLKSPSRHQVDTQGSGLSALKSPSRHQVDTQGSGLSVLKSPSRHQVDTQGSGLSVLKSPSRHQVDTQGSGLSVLKSPSRHQVDTHGSGLSASKLPSGQGSVDALYSSKAELTLSSNMSASVDNLNERTLSTERADGNRWKSLDCIDNVVSSNGKRKGTALAGNELKSYRLSQ